MLSLDSPFKVVVAVGGGLFIAYCIYFDHKRRSAPDFKEKLKKKRQKETQNREAAGSQMPNLGDAEACKKFFFQELQVGEEMLAMGEIEEGIEHLSNAIVVSGEPTHILKILQSTLPPNIFQLLLIRLPLITQRMSAGPSLDDDSRQQEKKITEMVEDDVE